MAIRAGVHTRQQQAAARLGDLAQTPGKQGKVLLGQRLNHTGLRFRGDQWHVTVEDWRTHGILRGLDRYRAARERLRCIARWKSGDGDDSCMLPGVQLDSLPGCRIRY